MATVPLPTALGLFEAQAFECASGFVYLALVRGDVVGEQGVLTRLHSECLTGDALGSLRCDCGIQLRLALRTIAAHGSGVLVYATGHEGRGIGLVEKLRAYVEQDQGADTLDANLRLGHVVDGRDYGDAAAVLGAVGLRSIRLLTNNPDKVSALKLAGVQVDAVVPLATAPHARNLAYLRTKERRLGHTRPAGPPVEMDVPAGSDPTQLLGPVRPGEDRPYVVLKFAQTVDGRIATADGDARWISGDEERRISHALRASCDAVMVGVGTVLRDDPELTVRMVAGASPLRVVLDSHLRTPTTAKVLSSDVPTLILTSDRARQRNRQRLQARNVAVRVVRGGAGGLDLAAAMAVLREEGVSSLMVEGGARVITSLLAAGLVDRMIIGVAPTIIGQGTQAVGQLGVTRVADGIRLTNRSVQVLSDDILLAWDVEPS
ncbi:MAG: GTP cyclohydrolase II RibA [Acidimicrobiales bacterium]